MAEFFKKAFNDMKESAKAQHDVDKANFAAVKAESKAQIEEAKAMRNPEKRRAMMQPTSARPKQKNASKLPRASKSCKQMQGA